VRSAAAAIGSLEGDGRVYLNAWGMQSLTTLTIGGNNRSTDFYGLIQDPAPWQAGAIVKVGTGVLTLWGDGTYRGTTTVSNGTLRVNGALDFSPLYINGGTGVVNGVVNGGVTVSGGTLKGNGVVYNGVDVALGTLAPGESAGTLTVDYYLYLESGSIYEAELNGTTAGSLYDQVVVKGDVYIDSFTGYGALLTLKVGFSPVPGDMFRIIDNQGANPIMTGGDYATFINALEGDTFYDQSGTQQFTITYLGGTGGNDVVVTYIIPEPMTLSTVLLGGLGALLARWWRRRFTI